MGHRGAMVCCTLDQEPFFSEYLLKGVSAQDNEIYLEFAPGNVPSSMLFTGSFEVLDY